MGANFVQDEKKLIESADIIIQMNLMDEQKTAFLKSNQTFIGILNPYENKSKLEELTKKKLTYFLWSYCQE